MSEAQASSTVQSSNVVDGESIDLEATAQVTERIGARVTDLRTQQNLKITDLARRISVSPSLISQIERGRSRPSVTTLFGLSLVLGVPVDAFFESMLTDDREQRDAARKKPPWPHPASQRLRGAESKATWSEPTSPVVGYMLKRTERPTLEIGGGVRWERLRHRALQGLEFMEFVYEPGAESAPEFYRHPGIELVVIIENCLDITVGFEVNRLGLGDSIAFASSMPHRYVNTTQRVSRAITAILRDDPLRHSVGHHQDFTPRGSVL